MNAVDKIRPEDIGEHETPLRREEGGGRLLCLDGQGDLGQGEDGTDETPQETVVVPAKRVDIVVAWNNLRLRSNLYREMALRLQKDGKLVESAYQCGRFDGVREALLELIGE